MERGLCLSHKWIPGERRCIQPGGAFKSTPAPLEWLLSEAQHQPHEYSLPQGLQRWGETEPLSPSTFLPEISWPRHSLECGNSLHCQEPSGLGEGTDFDLWNLQISPLPKRGAPAGLEQDATPKILLNTMLSFALSCLWFYISSEINREWTGYRSPSFSPTVILPGPRAAPQVINTPNHSQDGRWGTAESLEEHCAVSSQIPLWCGLGLYLLAQRKK